MSWVKKASLCVALVAIALGVLWCGQATQARAPANPTGTAEVSGLTYHDENDPPTYEVLMTHSITANWTWNDFNPPQAPMGEAILYSVVYKWDYTNNCFASTPVDVFSYTYPNDNGIYGHEIPLFVPDEGRRYHKARIAVTLCYLPPYPNDPVTVAEVVRDFLVDRGN